MSFKKGLIDLQVGFLVTNICGLVRMQPYLDKSYTGIYL